MRQIIGLMRGQGAALEPEALACKTAMMKQETNTILEAVLDAGNGDAALGTVRGFETGL